MKCGRATTALWLLRGKLCGVVKNLGNQAAAWQIHASNSYPTFQGSAMQCPDCAHLTARQMEEEGSIQHALLSCCCTQERYTKQNEEKPFYPQVTEDKKQPTQLFLKTKQKLKKTKAKVIQTCIEISITDCMLNTPRKMYCENSYCIWSVFHQPYSISVPPKGC